MPSPTAKTVSDVFGHGLCLLFGFYAQYIDLVIVLGAGAGDVGDQGVDLHDQRALGGQIGLAVHQVFLAVNQQVGDADLRCHGVPAAVQRQAAPGGVPIIAKGIGDDRLQPLQNAEHRAPDAAVLIDAAHAAGVRLLSVDEDLGVALVLRLVFCCIGLRDGDERIAVLRRTGGIVRQAAGQRCGCQR